eukprot:2844151-Rhodomonas_salina.1
MTNDQRCTKENTDKVIGEKVVTRRKYHTRRLGPLRLALHSHSTGPSSSLWQGGPDSGSRESK